MNDTDLSITLSKCKEGSIIAFKSREGEWYTGKIRSLIAPNSKDNKDNIWSLKIDVNLPIEPEWYRDNKTVYYHQDIVKIKLIER